MRSFLSSLHGVIRKLPKVTILLALLLVCQPLNRSYADSIADDKSEGSEEKCKTAIGIDLGTTYSCVAVYRNGAVQIIPNDIGERITPSRVAYITKGNYIVGSLADSKLGTHPASVIYDAKRLIGRDYTDQSVQADRKRWPFKIVEQKNERGGKLYIQASPSQDDASDFLLTPEEVSAHILKKLKSVAEDYLGEKVCTAVITVPAYFNDAQRQLTKDAAAIAGLKVSRIINEPTAAAIAYGLNNKDSITGAKNPRILVYDLGGGTFDVSILDLENGMFEVIGTGGNTHLGGQDFDRNLVDYALNTWLKKIDKKFKKDDISPKSMALLYSEAEKAKRILSSTLEATINVPNFHNGTDFVQSVSRAAFEHVNQKLFDESIEVVRSVLGDAKSTIKDIDEIVLVGGSTRIPKVEKMLTDLFKKAPKKSINPDEAVAYGASVQAAILAGEKDSNVDNVLLLDVTSLTFGIEVQGGVMAPVIPRNTLIPTEKSQIFTTVADSQPSVVIKVYEGERPMAKDNHELGKFELTGIPLAPRGVPQINVTFYIDADGMLKVEATDKGSGNTRSTVVRNDSRRLSPEQIQSMIKESEENADRDNEVKQLVEAKNGLEMLLYSSNSLIKTVEKKLDSSKVKSLTEKIKAIEDWYSAHRDTCTRDQVIQKTEELKEEVSNASKLLYSPDSDSQSGSNPTGENFIPPTADTSYSDFGAGGDI